MRSRRRWHTEYEIAALDIDCLVHYRGSTPMATANNAQETRQDAMILLTYRIFNRASVS